jgi:hypothetical protein
MSYLVILFDSVSSALLTEKILKGEGIPHKLIPVPKSISSDCGVCIRIDPVDEARAGAAIDNKVGTWSVHSLPS